MKGKGMMQRTVARLLAKERKKKKVAIMDLNNQTGHINQALNVTNCKCPQ